jgi:hypothetical protein
VGVYELTQGWNKPTDNVGELMNVVSDNPDAFWTSKHYFSPNFGESGGFGLVLQLSGREVLHDLVVESPMTGWSARTYVSAEDHGTLGGWGNATAHHQDINGDATFSLGGSDASWVLLWMLDPGPSGTAVVDKLVLR